MSPADSPPDRQPGRAPDQPPLLEMLRAIEVDAGVLAYANSLGEAGWKRLVAIATREGEGEATPPERARAVFLLGALRWRPAFTAVRTLLADESATVRLNAIHALGAVGGPHAIVPLFMLVKDTAVDLSSRAHALERLADIGDESTLVELEVFMKEQPDQELRRVAQVATRRMRTILEGLKERLAKSDT